MDPERKRPRRNPLSFEEVSNIIAHKKKIELERTEKFKTTFVYKIQNIFNVVCFCIYLEMLFCYFGPCNYQTHYGATITARYGTQVDPAGTPLITDMNISCVEGTDYHFIVEDFLRLPGRYSSFEIGSDFVLNRDLKGIPEGTDKTYRIFAASSALFLSFFVLTISLGAFIYNLNENAYSLMALTVLNALTLLGIMML